MSDKALVFSTPYKEPKGLPNRAFRRAANRTKVRCSQCGIPVRIINYDRHFDRVHPVREEPSMENLIL